MVRRKRPGLAWLPLAIAIALAPPAWPDELEALRQLVGSSAAVSVKLESVEASPFRYGLEKKDFERLLASVSQELESLVSSGRHRDALTLWARYLKALPKGDASERFRKLPALMQGTIRVEFAEADSLYRAENYAAAVKICSELIEAQIELGGLPALASKAAKSLELAIRFDGLASRLTLRNAESSVARLAELSHELQLQHGDPEGSLRRSRLSRLLADVPRQAAVRDWTALRETLRLAEGLGLAAPALKAELEEELKPALVGEISREVSPPTPTLAPTSIPSQAPAPSRAAATRTPIREPSSPRPSPTSSRSPSPRPTQARPTQEPSPSPTSSPSPSPSALALELPPGMLERIREASRAELEFYRQSLSRLPRATSWPWLRLEGSRIRDTRAELHLLACVEDPSAVVERLEPPEVYRELLPLVAAKVLEESPELSGVEIFVSLQNGASAPLELEGWLFEPGDATSSRAHITAALERAARESDPGAAEPSPPPEPLATPPSPAPPQARPLLREILDELLDGQSAGAPRRFLRTLMSFALASGLWLCLCILGMSSARGPLRQELRMLLWLGFALGCLPVFLPPFFLPRSGPGAWIGVSLLGGLLGGLGAEAWMSGAIAADRLPWHVSAAYGYGYRWLGQGAPSLLASLDYQLLRPRLPEAFVLFRARAPWLLGSVLIAELAVDSPGLSRSFNDFEVAPAAFWAGVLLCWSLLQLFRWVARRLLLRLDPALAHRPGGERQDLLEHESSFRLLRSGEVRWAWLLLGAAALLQGIFVPQDWADGWPAAFWGCGKVCAAAMLTLAAFVRAVLWAELRGGWPRRFLDWAVQALEALPQVLTSVLLLREASSLLDRHGFDPGGVSELLTGLMAGMFGIAYLARALAAPLGSLRQQRHVRCARALGLEDRQVLTELLLGPVRRRLLGVAVAVAWMSLNLHLCMGFVFEKTLTTGGSSGSGLGQLLVRPDQGAWPFLASLLLIGAAGVSHWLRAGQNRRQVGE